MHKCTCPYYLWSFSFMFLYTNTHWHTYMSPHLVKPHNILTFHLKKPPGMTEAGAVNCVFEATVISLTFSFNPKSNLYTVFHPTPSLWC